MGVASADPAGPGPNPQDPTMSVATIDPEPAPRLNVPRHPLLDVTGRDLHVPVVTSEDTVRYVNLDYAATAPAMRRVVDHVADVLPYYASVHRGAGYASQVSSALYEQARADVAAFVGAGPDDVVVFTRHTTDALNLLAKATPDGTVVFLDLEHHANLLPWLARPHRRVEVATTIDETLDRLDRALIETPAVLLAITGASNVTGEVVPLDLVTDLAHSHRVRVAVDAAQLAPHRRVSLRDGGVDYLALSGHKLYAPYGAGVLAGARDWLDAAAPHLLGGGGLEDSPDGAIRWGRAPARHEAGTPNLLGAAALAQACRVMSELAPGALTYHEEALLGYLEDQLKSIPGVTLHRLWPGHGERVGAVAFTVAGYPAGLVAAYLSAEHGIGVRDGRFCAYQLLDRLGLRDGAVRASVGLGSTAADVERLANALDALVAEGPTWRYALTDGQWQPVDDPRSPVAQF